MCWFSGQANTPPLLEAFFTASAANGLAINLEKCVFATPSLEILGNRISLTGAAPTADHAAEIKNCPPPQDVKQLQRFLGMEKLLPPFFAQVCTGLESFNRSPEGWGQNVGVDRFRLEGIPKC
jgi:hypothetical protein